MGFNLTEITNKKVPIEEQSGYSLSFIPCRVGFPASATGWSDWWYPSNADSSYAKYSTTINASSLVFGFRGRRVGLVLNRQVSLGALAFDIDGQSYGTFDANTYDGTRPNPSGGNFTSGQLPLMIAIDLDDRDHLLTITKLDSHISFIYGIVVDDASASQYYTRSILDYQNSVAPNTPVAIGTSLTIIKPISAYATSTVILLNAIIYNTTASTIYVQLQDGSGNVVVGGGSQGFPVSAGDFRQIPGPLYFTNGIKAIASATGCTISLGGQ